MPVRFAHTNIVARDWRRLARFYQEVFDCRRVPPERDYRGPTIGEIAGVGAERLTGVHLRVPGHGDDGPTLELFQYEPEGELVTIRANTPGFSHIAFAVDDVRAMAERVFEHGGRPVGVYREIDIAGAGRLAVWYVADPEGNIVELQAWL